MCVPDQNSDEGRISALQRWLTCRLEPDASIEIEKAERPRIGYSAETLLLDIRYKKGGIAVRRSFVVRIRPSKPGMFPDVDFEFHHRILQLVAGAGLPAPRSLWYCDADESPLGEPFFVMERIDGRVPPENPPYAARGWLADADPHVQANVFNGAIEQMACLHRLDWTTYDLNFIPSVAAGQPGMAFEFRSLRRYADWVLDKRTDEVIDAAFDLLDASLPQSSRLCLNWGDPKLSNIIFDQDRLVGLLDWELATIAPPENDVAFFFVYHHLITGAAGYDELPGFPSEADALAFYERKAGFQLENLGWYRLWHQLRLDLMSFRFTQLLKSSGRITESVVTTPHVTPRRLLKQALASRI